MPRVIPPACAPSRVLLLVVLIGAGAWAAGAAARVQQASSDVQPAAAAGKEHPEIPDTEGSTCIECHDAIGKKKVVHEAVSAGLCASCHEFSGEGEQTRVALAGSATRDAMADVCVSCHDGVGEAMKAPRAHAALADGNCLACHDPHESDEAKLLSAPQSELCATCHESIAAELKRKTTHPPASASCAVCHDPHGGAVERHLREPLNGLCLSCHSATAAAVAEPPVLFGREQTPAVARLMQPGKRVALDPLQRRDHPIVGHPVRGPRDPLVPERPLSCVSCHTPHGSDQPALSRFEYQSASEVCVKCHK